MLKAAIFSPDRKYRYVLTRTWGEGDSIRYVNFIGLNPSTADERVDDNTIRRCIRFARDWGYDGLSMTNLFGLRSTDPRRLYKDVFPVGPDNRRWLIRQAVGAGLVVCAWGTKGNWLDMDKKAVSWLRTQDLDLYCFGRSRAGHPLHPLRLAATTRPQRYR
jgi:hypothetical protein